MAAEQASSQGDSKFMVFFVIFVVSIFLLLFYIFLPATSVTLPKQTKCGDGICGEDCFTCPMDCPCKAGETCYNDLKKCGKIPSEVGQLLEREYGNGGYQMAGSWVEGGDRVFLASARERVVLIKNGTITEMEPL